MPRGNPTRNTTGKHLEGSVGGHRKQTGIQTFRLDGFEELLRAIGSGGGGGGGLPPIDSPDAVEKGLATAWDVVTLPEGAYDGQLLFVPTAGDYDQPGGGTIRLPGGTITRWGPGGWSIICFCKAPEDAHSAVEDKGAATTWPVDEPDLPEGQWDGQFVIADDDGTLTQPDGTTPLPVASGDILVWDPALGTGGEWYVLPTAPGGTVLPPTSETQAVSYGIPVLWTGLAGLTLPVGHFIGQMLMVTVADTLQPDGVTPTNALVGDALVWATTEWVVLDMVTQGDLDLFVAATTAALAEKMDKAANLSDVASAATSRTNLDVYSKAETDTADGLRLLKSANLSDVASVPFSRTNLDVYSTGEVDALLGDVYSETEVDTLLAAKMDKTADLSDVNSVPDARANLDVYSTAEVDDIAALKLAKASNLSDVASASTSRTNIDVYSKAEVDALIAALGSGGILTGRLGTMLRLLPSFVEPFEERSQHANYWATDAPAGGTIGTVATNPTPPAQLGGLGWVRLLPGTASNHIAMWPTTSDLGWPTLTSGWITVAFRFHLRNITSGTISMLGLGGPMAAGSAPVNHWAITYSGGTWFLSLAETSESTSTAAFTSAPPTPTNSDSAWWGMIQVEPTGHVIAMVRPPSGTEYVTARTLPAWGDPASITRQIQPWFLANLGSPLQEMFLDQVIMWDGATLQISTAPIAS